MCSTSILVSTLFSKGLFSNAFRCHLCRDAMSGYGRVTPETPFATTSNYELSLTYLSASPTQPSHRPYTESSTHHISLLVKCEVLVGSTMMHASTMFGRARQVPRGLGGSPHSSAARIHHQSAKTAQNSNLTAIAQYTSRLLWSRDFTKSRTAPMHKPQLSNQTMRGRKYLLCPYEQGKNVPSRRLQQ